MGKASGMVILVFFSFVFAVCQGQQAPSMVNGLEKDPKLKLFSLSDPYNASVIDPFFNKNQLIPPGINFQPGVADALVNLGKYFMDQGEYDTAYKYLIAYRNFCTQSKDSLFLAEASALLALLYRKQNLLTKSEAEYRNAVTIADQNDNQLLLGKLYNQLGSLMYLQEEYGQAIFYFTKSLDELSPENDKVEFAAALHNIGMVYKAQKEHRKALDFLIQALDILEDLQISSGLSAVMLNIGEIYENYNYYDLSERYYQAALKAAFKVNAIEQIVESYNHLARMSAHKEQYKKAFKYKELHDIYKDSLTVIEKRANRNAASKKLEVARRENVMAQLIQEKELDMLNKEYKMSKLTISRKNELIWFTCLSSLLLSMLTVVLYQGYKLKKRRNDQLEKEHYRTSIHNLKLQEINEKLQQSERQLKELNETKDKFFSIISHDLRSPLNTLSGFMEIMKKDISIFSPEEVNKFSSQMEQSLNGVAALLDNLFQWASSQTGLIEFSPEEFVLNIVVEENIALLQATAGLKEINLSAEVDENLTLKADIQMMRLLLRNLISNAIKFTPRGGWVKVCSQVVNDEVILEIKDNGVGMTEETRKKLLDSSSVFSQRGTENEKGSGLGLLLCKEFVHKHNGQIEIKTAPGEGTVFIIKLSLYTTKNT